MEKSLDAAEEAAEVLNENKAENITILDVSENFQISDYFLIATGQSQPHLNFLKKEIKKNFPERVERETANWEGNSEQGWLLSDYGDIVIHLFTEEKRAYYDLEGLWADADVISA